MQTLRMRLLIGTALGSGLVVSVFALVVYIVVRASLWAEFDAALGSKARSLAGLVEQEGDDLELQFDEINMAGFMPSSRAEYYQYWSAGGRVLARSPSLGKSDLKQVGQSADSPTYRSVDLPDGRPGRVVGMSYVVRRGIEDQEDGKENEHGHHDEEDDEEEEHGHHDESPQSSSGEPLVVTLVVGRDTLDIGRTLSLLRWILTLGCAAATLASVGVLSAFVRRGLAPLGHLAAEIATIGEANLSSRLATKDAPGELMPIITRLNDLLARLETAFAREKGLTADIAHELRTPLAGLRSTLEVTLSKERSAPAYREGMAKSLAIGKQMQWMVENLLELARVDAGQIQVISEPIDLVALVKACWAQVADRAAERQLEVTWQLPESCLITGDRGKLSLVLIISSTMRPRTPTSAGGSRSHFAG